MQEYYGESLKRLKYVEQICLEQLQLYNFQEVRTNDLLVTLQSIEKSEINKYFSYNDNIYSFFIMTREDNYADIEMLQLVTDILNKLNIKYKVKFNYLGCLSCLHNYQNSLNNELSKIHGYTVDNAFALLKKQPMNTETKLILCNKCLKDYNSLLAGLNIYFPDAEFNLSYLNDYSRLVFEVVEEKTNTALFTGGRLLNKSGINCTFNVNSILKFIHQHSLDYNLDVLLLIEKLEYRQKAFNLLRQLRSNNFKADIIMQEKSHKLLYTRKYLLEQSARVILIFEPKQMKKNSVTIKDLNNEVVTSMPLTSIIPILNGIFNRHKL